MYILTQQFHDLGNTLLMVYYYESLNSVAIEYGKHSLSKFRLLFALIPGGKLGAVCLGIFRICFLKEEQLLIWESGLERKRQTN